MLPHIGSGRSFVVPHMGRLRCIVVASALCLFEMASSKERKEKIGVRSLGDASEPHKHSSAMVHLFEWSWADIAIECEEWLGPKGFTAVQVSPPTDHIDRPAWWSRYQPVTFKLQSRSGSEAAFVDMVRRCKATGVGVYVDAVLNHVAAGSGVSIVGSHYGNRSTPIWRPQDFHHLSGDTKANCAVKNYQDKYNVQRCDMLGMPDLCTGCPGVRAKMASYLRRLIDLGVAGFRIDSAKHIDSGELKQLLAEASRGRKTFWYQEVFGGVGEAVSVHMYVGNGALEYFDYSKRLAPNIRDEGKLGSMHHFGESWGLLPSDNAVVFLDNHDTQRAAAILSYRDARLYEFASIFMLAHPYGYPKIMSSFYFSTRDQGPPSHPVHGPHGLACGGNPEQIKATPGRPWVCEHRWPSLANMVGWRRSAGSNSIGAWWAHNGDSVYFCRGSVACIVFNRASSLTWKVSLTLPLPPGTYCNIIVSDNATSCPRVDVTQGGMAQIEVPPISAVALHVGSMASGAHQTHGLVPANVTRPPRTTSRPRTTGRPSPEHHPAPAPHVGSLATDASKTHKPTSATVTQPPRTTSRPSPMQHPAQSGRAKVSAQGRLRGGHVAGSPVATLIDHLANARPEEEPPSFGLEACLARASKPGGLCHRWKSKTAGKICYAYATFQCCKLNGAGRADCCALPEVQSLPKAYRKISKLRRCFANYPKETALML